MEKGQGHPSREEISALALGALDPDETGTVSRHVQGCADCQRILTEYQQVADGLLLAAPPQEAPRQLRARLARVVDGKPVTAREPDVPQAPVARPPPSTDDLRFAGTRRGGQPRRLRINWMSVGLGLAVLALLAMNVGLAVRIRLLERQQQALLQLIDENQSSLALVAQPGMRALPITGERGEGNLVISPDGKQAILFLRGLPEISPSRTYQVWLIPAEGAPESAGLMERQDSQPYSSFILQSPVALNSYAAIGVSVEPAGGSAAPTREPIIVIDLKDLSL